LLIKSSKKRTIDANVFISDLGHLII